MTPTAPLLIWNFIASHMMKAHWSGMLPLGETDFHFAEA